MRRAIALSGIPGVMARIGLTIITLATGVGIGAGAMAVAHGGDTTQIHACVDNVSGLVRVVGPDDECQTGETPLDWNIQSPAGPQGEPGPVGLQGVPGANGDGIVAYAHVVVNLDDRDAPFHELDEANSLNVNLRSVSSSVRSWACFDLVNRPHGGIATVQPQFKSGSPLVTNIRASLTTTPGVACPFAFRDALVFVEQASHYSRVLKPFYVVFY